MPTTQIPPGNPATPQPPGSQNSASRNEELYDSQYWESLYLEDRSTPHLLVQLQDELSVARRREAFWLSVVVHMVIILVIFNSDKLMRLLPRSPVIVANLPNRDKDTTFLEMPPDEQKVTERPKTNIASDKDRVAMSKSPQIDRKELKKILDASRAGRPGISSPPSPQTPPGSSPPAPAPQTQQPSPPPPPQPQEQAKLQMPPSTPNPFAKGFSESPGQAIADAARAVAANRGGGVGDNGDYGLGTGAKPTAAMGPLDVLSDTMGVDFGPYLQRVLHEVKVHWYTLIPESARPPIMKKGNVVIEFAILKDGSVSGMKLVSTSGDVALDRGAWGGITSSNPFPPLPSEFGGQYLALRFKFLYNPARGELQ
jgi:TonB family protein